MNKIINTNKGFTIVETLVAVAILMISIAGPLTIAQKGLMAALYARDQVTASFLAQELMEQIKYTRDNYVADQTKGFNTPVVGFIDNVANILPCPQKPVRLYTDANGKYVVSDETPSRFSRSYCFYKMLPDTLNINDEVTAVVRVTWENGTMANEVRLESELFNLER